MRRKIAIITVVLLAGLCMGGTCSQETSQAAIGTFLNAVAQTVGQAIGESLVNSPSP